VVALSYTPDFIETRVPISLICTDNRFTELVELQRQRSVPGPLMPSYEGNMPPNASSAAGVVALPNQSSGAGASTTLAGSDLYYAKQASDTFK